MKNNKLTNVSVIAILFVIIVFGLSGCGEDKQKQVEQFGFKSLEDCLNNPKFTKQDCQGAYEKALKDFNIKAPKFSSLEDCEKHYGQGKCGTNAQQSQVNNSGGNVWLPLMTGWMMNDLINGANRGYNNYDDRDRNRNYAPPISSYQSSATSNSFRNNKSSFTRSNVSRATSRGGFTSSRGSFGRSGGFGG